jgi:hypothetical protein
MYYTVRGASIESCKLELQLNKVGLRPKSSLIYWGYSLEVAIEDDDSEMLV